MAMSPRKKEAGAGGTGGSAVNIGNAAPGGKKPKKMMRGGPAKKSGGMPDLSGDGKVTQKDVLIGRGNGAGAGHINFKNGSQSGTTQHTEYVRNDLIDPYIPDDGIRFPDGCYMQATASAVVGLSIYFDG